MENKLEKLFVKTSVKPTRDIIIGNVNNELCILANQLKIAQMRIGKAWEIVATYHGWTKTTKIDLINYETKQAVELKNATNTDNDSGRKFNYQKLLQFKEDYPGFEIAYVCINNRTTKVDEYKILQNGIRFITGEQALLFLFGAEYNLVVEQIQKAFLKSMITLDSE